MVFGFYFMLLSRPVKMDAWLVKPGIPVSLPVFSKAGDINGNVFKWKDLLNSVMQTSNESGGWENLQSGMKFGITDDGEKRSLIQLKTYVAVDRWMKGCFKIKMDALFELFLDGKKVTGKSDGSNKSHSVPLTLDTGKHELLVMVVAEREIGDWQAEFLPDKGFEGGGVHVTTHPGRAVQIHDILDGEKISELKISPSGEYLYLSLQETIPPAGESTTRIRIINLKRKMVIWDHHHANHENVTWLPKTDRLSYLVKTGDTHSLYLYDLVNGNNGCVAKNLQKVNTYWWSPRENFLVFSQSYPEPEKKPLKRIQGVSDRLPYYRDRSFLSMLDLQTGILVPVTKGHFSSNLQDISPQGRKILFSTVCHDYSKVPFTKQDLYEMDVKTMACKTIWKDKPYGGFCQYSPDGRFLLVQGGPKTFGKIGVNTAEDRIPNDYDGQLYIFHLNDQSVEPITKNFDPSVFKAYWFNSDTLYIGVGEKEYKNLYRYSLKKKSFTKIPLKVEVLNSIDFSRKGNKAVYLGSSHTTPEKVFCLDLKNKVSRMVSFPEQNRFKDIGFGKTESWNFTNKKGDTIYGRVYYPYHYQPGKTYPVIVNYYGGTSPIDRSFGGRYPINTWAARGYMVYVLQPSGATGFGQDFSALHVNGWGRDAIEDIIDGTKKFLAAHPEADAKNVGCIGASYGGYTAMLLQTRTDIFKTAISHAGISSITSYWGEGYWGYSYSTAATKFSYPWNRKDIYVENSPIYNADKFKNSMLLLHGTGDTNVPVGESLQYYAALKILGKDVEMVLVEGQNHWILDYKKRIQWHHTILSWFDWRLKDQSQQWDDMYPSLKL